MKIRLPADLKERVQGAAQHAKQSLNALIVSVLEKEFPHPSIDLYSVAALLEMLVGDERNAGDEGSFTATVNAGLAKASDPWRVEVDDGRVIFYPVFDPEKKAEAIRRLVEKGLRSG